MAFWKRRSSSPVDRISSDALADFGRFEFLGRDQSGVDSTDAYSLVSALVSSSYPPDGPAGDEVVEELRRHAAKGEWEKVGAWKYVRNFLDTRVGVDDLIDGGLLAIHRMRVTNLGIHLAPVDSPRFAELAGGPPPNDGFVGPPVFESDFGPTRQYYFDHALSTAARRNIARLPAAAGVEPGAVVDAARSMWGFGMLICRGPLVVNPDVAFEPNVVKPAVDAATGVDHVAFAEKLVDAALVRDSHFYGPWTSIGAARFIEEYLQPEVADSPSCARVIDDGLTQLLQMGLMGVAMTPEVLTPRQRERLEALGG